MEIFTNLSYPEIIVGIIIIIIILFIILKFILSITARVVLGAIFVGFFSFLLYYVFHFSLTTAIILAAFIYPIILLLKKGMMIKRDK